MTAERTASRVLILDVASPRRDALVSKCDLIAGIEVVGATGSMDEALDQVRAMHPDVVLVDLDACRKADLKVFGRACQEAGASMIFVTSGEKSAVLAQATQWGAAGFLKRSAPAETIGHAVKAVRAGAFFLDPERARGMVEELDVLRGVAGRDAGDILTPREREVLELLSDGLSARQVARRLGLSERTINTHVANLYRKLGVSNRVQAVREAIRLGLVVPPT
ncbi:MAG: LuxR C-terminal-related transcriptional regulator [Actinomycetota bacterium]